MQVDILMTRSRVSRSDLSRISMYDFSERILWWYIARGCLVSPLALQSWANVRFLSFGVGAQPYLEPVPWQAPTVVRPITACKSSCATQSVRTRDWVTRNEYERIQNKSMFASEEFADVIPRCLGSSEPDKTRRKELEVDLTDQNLGIGSLIPASNIDNSVLFENRVEYAKGVDLSGSVSDAVVRKLEADGFLEVGHCRWANSKPHKSSLVFILAGLPLFTLDPQWACGHGISFRARCSGWGFGAAAGISLEERMVGVTWMTSQSHCVSVVYPFLINPSATKVSLGVLWQQCGLTRMLPATSFSIKIGYPV